MSDTRYIVSVSGGKDSTVLYLWAIEQFGAKGFDAVFADTGNEHPVTLNYVRNLHTMAKGPEVVMVQADFKDRITAKNKTASGNPFLDMMIWKGRAPSTKAQFCTEHVKLRPIADWLKLTSDAREPVMLTGIRAGESLRRSKLPEREWVQLFDCETWRPLLNWSEEQVFEKLRIHGVPPNPLYLAGFSRVGCFPCIHARKSELARLPDWAWEKLEQWEAILGRSWFPAGLIPGVFIPTIAQAREWSKTLRGGRVADPNAPDGVDVPSCMATWGACE